MQEMMMSSKVQTKQPSLKPSTFNPPPTFPKKQADASTKKENQSAGNMQTSRTLVQLVENREGILCIVETFLLRYLKLNSVIKLLRQETMQTIINGGTLIIGAVRTSKPLQFYLTSLSQKLFLWHIMDSKKTLLRFCFC